MMQNTLNPQYSTRENFLSFSPKALNLFEGRLRAFGASIHVLTIKTTSECEVYIFQSKQANQEKCRVVSA